MQRFLTRIFLFAAFPLLLGVAWTAYVVFMDYRSYTAALKLPDGTTVAVCGDSQTKDALDPALIPSFANFSTAATTCDQDILRLSDLLVANLGKLKYMLLDISPLKVGYMDETLQNPPRPPRPVSELNAGRVHSLLHFYHITKNRRPLGSIGAIWRDVVCVRKYNEFRKSILRGKKWRSSMAGAFDPGKERGFLEPRYRERAMSDTREKADRVNRRDPARLELPIFSILSESAGLVRAAGAEPVITTMPLSRQLREMIAPGKLADFSKSVREVARRLGVPYLDYLSLDLPAECWHDGNHLNRHGSGVFSRRFAADLARITALRGRAENCRVEYVHEIKRPVRPEGLSGLSYAGDDMYWSVGDSCGQLYSLKMPVDRETGRLAGCEVVSIMKVPGGVDLEGVANDSLRGSLWLSDEDSPSVFEFVPGTGTIGEKVELPASFIGIKSNHGLEALEISPSGLDLWTCNEVELPADGTAAPGKCEFVRLTRFSRKDMAGKWRLSGQWAYRPESSGGVDLRRRGRNGVSSIAVLPDGRIVVLEREKASRSTCFRIRICLVDVADATDIRGWMSLGDADFVPVKKRLLFERGVGDARYEGICFGPTLADGSLVLLLVSDGDGVASEKVMVLRMHYDHRSRPELAPPTGSAPGLFRPVH